ALARATRRGELGLRACRASLLEARCLLAGGAAREAMARAASAITEAEAQRDWEALSQALAVRAQALAATGADLHARKDRERGLRLRRDLAGGVGEEAGLEGVLDQAVRSAVELTSAERGALLLAGDGALVLRARVGPRQGDGPDDVVSRSIADTVWIDGEPVVT